MQRQRSIFDPFPEALDLNQGSNSNSMDESDDWNILSPIERRLLNNDLSSELNFSCANTATNNNHNFRSFSSWDVGESSSRASLQDQSSNDNSKFEQSRPFSNTHNSRFDEQQLESSTTIHPRDNFLAGPSHTPMNVNLNVEYDDDEDDDDDGIGFMDIYKSGRPGMDASGSSTGVGPSEYGPGSSLGNWGLSCKRKALEGSSMQRLNDGNASRSLNISSNLVNPVAVNHREPPTARIGVGMMRGLAASEGSQTHLGIRSSVPYNYDNNNNNTRTNNYISSTRNPTRSPNINSSNNRQISLNEFLGQNVPSNSSNPQPSLIQVPNISRNGPNYPWGSRGSSSLGIPLRNNMHYHNFIPLPETRSLVQDPTNWSLATGGQPGGTSSSSRTASGSGGSRPYNGVWTPHHGPAPPSQQRSSEFPPWTLFPSGDSESSGGRRGHFAPFPAGSPSTSEDTNNSNNISSVVASARQHYQALSRSALLMEVPGDDWRALVADIEGRQRLVSEIRQVLNAMRRGENLRAEDYMLFDPFINGVAELHDRHRDMRLDVDNMSYEELLALEERIGNVNTGLNEEVILKSMKQRKHIAFMAISTQNLEPCCICQEEYDTGDNIGSLDCGHDFHTDCIKQWLSQKNICPICKMTGLAP